MAWDETYTGVQYDLFMSHFYDIPQYYKQVLTTLVRVCLQESQLVFKTFENEKNFKFLQIQRFSFLRSNHFWRIAYFLFILK